MRINIENKIPKDTCYCYSGNFNHKTLKVENYKKCPYWKIKKSDYGFGGKKEPREYCKYLKRYLTINDQVKDCGINYNYEKVDFVDKQTLSKMETVAEKN